MWVSPALDSSSIASSPRSAPLRWVFKRTREGGAARTAAVIRLNETGLSVAASELRVVPLGEGAHAASTTVAARPMTPIRIHAGMIAPPSPRNLDRWTVAIIVSRRLLLLENLVDEGD